MAYKTESNTCTKKLIDSDNSMMVVRGDECKGGDEGKGGQIYDDGRRLDFGW